MNEGRTSPKRRHILSSINPEDPANPPPRYRATNRRSRSATPPPRSPPEKPSVDSQANEPEDGDTTRPRRSRLKLKGDRSSRIHQSHRSSRRHRSRGAHADDGREESRRHRHRSRDASEHHDHHDEPSHRRRHRHRNRRRSRSPTPPNPHEPEPLDPEAAFRESLFDAMADDEGAAYWEGVYGQPVHIYEQDKVGPQGELERMTDEEYAAHVRQKMWEKTHAGLLEERARREERRRRKEEEARRGRHGTPARVAWPWEGGKAKRAAGWGIVEDGAEEEVDEGEVRAFFVQGLAAEEIGEVAFATKLKDERVRWHPDKMQQRLGGAVDDKVMRDVTAIFQIIDRLWGEMRNKEST
ncbi:hypothetical protein ISF_01941 [Cordyceps fumosorosea ARSEF 2679]|uniref:Uncharacterized protein n=1 Tax=Cordyceps fumosorosea (strain ARSEF 2679) TaxID=1081104 RepID=A0A168CHR2_CORFA|nr:hypothetical protein ISF_01941 [Cordyceps fumosorosea ARSEF 2679]OAA71390.1 hypothetical protein ISF_01941 [Cordyceps fumosorosea ARSEF 2679]